MRREIRKKFVQKLWTGYINSFPFFNKLFPSENLPLDHLAIIDLPSQFSGIDYLTQILNRIGYVISGRDYLPEKQNFFLWVKEENSHSEIPIKVLPQIVVADFNKEALSSRVNKIVEKYANVAKAIDFVKLDKLEEEIDKGNTSIINYYVDYLYQHITTRQWPLPTLDDYSVVQNENELLAWVLVFGRKVNHFGVAIHLMENFKNLESFHQKVMAIDSIKFNTTPSLIKGNKQLGIIQSSTLGLPIKVKLLDKEISIPDSFMEFVWRFPIVDNPKLWSDYYPHFIPSNANTVIESLYTNR